MRFFPFVPQGYGSRAQNDMAKDDMTLRMTWPRMVVKNPDRAPTKYITPYSVAQASCLAQTHS
jgi:hypothetical protein